MAQRLQIRDGEAGPRWIVAGDVRQHFGRRLLRHAGGLTSEGRKAIAAYPGTIGDVGRLRDELVALLLDDNRPQDALAVRTQDFELHPTADNFSLLSKLARQAGTPDAAARALQHLRSTAAGDPAGPANSSPPYTGPGFSTRRGPALGRTSNTPPPSCSRNLVADREKTHPADVLDAYRELIDAQLEEAGAANYNRAIGLLRSLRAAHGAAGSPDDFTAYVADVRP